MTELTLERSPGHLTASPTIPRSIVIAIRGELDIATAPAIERELTAEATQRVDEITLDLSGLEFVDGAGLRVLDRVCRHHRSHQRQLRLRNVPRQASRMFRLAARASEISFTG